MAGQAAAIGQFGLHVERRYSDAASDQEIDAVGVGEGKALPSGPRMDSRAPGSARSSSGVPRPTFLARIGAACGRNRKQGESARQEGVPLPVAAQHDELPRPAVGHEAQPPRRGRNSPRQAPDCP